MMSPHSISETLRKFEMTRPINYFALVVSSLALAACGGGGGNSAGPASAPPIISATSGALFGLTEGALSLLDPSQQPRSVLARLADGLNWWH